MVKVKKISITRAEGPSDLCGRTVTVTPKPNLSAFVLADAELMRWSHTAPKGGGYDKCDFTIEFEDGETYEGRYDLKHMDDEMPNLRQHVLCFVLFYTGEYRPAHMTPDQYEQYLRLDRVEGASRWCHNVRRKYEPWAMIPVRPRGTSGTPLIVEKTPA